VLLAACTLDEVAGDAYIDTQPHGVFTYFLCQALKQSPLTATRAELLPKVRQLVKGGHWGQTPQFEARSLDEPLFADDTLASGPPRAQPNPGLKPVPKTGPRPVEPAPWAATQSVSRRRRLLEGLQGRRLEDAYLRDDVRTQVQQEANASAGDPDALLTRDSVQLLEQIIAARREQQAPLARARQASNREVARTRLLSSATAVIVPGFLASQLSDKAQSGHGLIWINPILDPFSDRLSYLKLGPLGTDGSEEDADPSVQILSDGPLPLVYDLLRGALETSLFGPRYWTNVFAYDWRRNLEDAANGLVVQMRSLKQQSPSWPIHLIAHSQGALVARKALQLLGPDSDLVEQLVLLGPANYGSLAAIRGMGNEAGEVDFVRKFAVEPSDDFNSILCTLSGLYQLIPSIPERIPWLKTNNVFDSDFWGTFPIDPRRLSRFQRWAEGINTEFFNERTTVILGDNKGEPTVGGVVIADGVMQIDGEYGMVGDGTITHSCAVLPGVTTYQSMGTEHGLLPTYPSVIQAVQQILAGKTPVLTEVSSDPADYVALQQMDTRSLSLPRKPEARVPTVTAVRDGVDGSALEQLARAVARVATGSGARVQVTIAAEPPSAR
jgi:hypothetical protein